jgi:vanillate O-demethylase monooxygenase subunit
MTELGNDHPALRRCWHPIERSSAIGSAPHRAVLLGEPWVLWRTDTGELVAFADRCPHRRAPLSLGSREGATIRCAYHGWRFDESGGCVEIPSLGPGASLPPRAALEAPAGLAEAHGMVYLAPEEPLNELPDMVEDGIDGFMVGDLAPITTRGAAALLADNFLDMAHFPYVHAGTFGTDEAAEVAPYEVERGDLSHQVVLTHAFANREDPGVAAGIRPLIQTRRLTYRYTAPFHLALRIDFLDAGGTNAIGFFLCPEGPETTRIYSSLWRDDLDGDPVRMEEAIDFEVAVVEEDLRLQSRFDLLSVPLEPNIEVHVRADKTTIEMRRILAELVDRASR